MKIISNLLTDIEGIQVYYIIGLLIFVTLFIVITVRTLKEPKQKMEAIKNSILDEENGEGHNL